MDRHQDLSVLTCVNAAGSPPPAARRTEPRRPGAAHCFAICALAVCTLAVGTVARSDDTAAAGARSRIHLSVRPAMAEANAVTRFRFVASRRVGDTLRPVRAATVSFAGVRATTDRRGRAVIVRRLDTGHYRARACKTSLSCGIARVVVLPHGAAR
jgi:hypothetical protein